MNGTEQRQRHTAVATIERQLEDVQLVVQTLAAQIVNDREEAKAERARLHLSTRMETETLRRSVGQLQDQVDVDRRHYLRTNQSQHDRIHEFVSMTFWQRLRWLVTGR